MEIIQINEIEQQFIDGKNEFGLRDAFEEWIKRYENGNRDKETIIRTMFFYWYVCSEPNWLTNLAINKENKFTEIYEKNKEIIENDFECCFVVGYMASLFPWCCGKESEWLKIGNKLKKKYKEKINPEIFNERGEYGNYFKHISSPLLKNKMKTKEKNA